MTSGVTCCVERGGKGKGRRMGAGGRADDSLWQGKFQSARVCVGVSGRGGVEWRVALTLGSASGTGKNLGGGVTGSRGVVVGGDREYGRDQSAGLGGERQKGKRGLQMPCLTSTLQRQDTRTEGTCTWWFARPECNSPVSN